MRQRSFLLIACLALGPISCSKSAAPPPVAPDHCTVESAGEVRLGDATELRIWNLRTSDLSELTVRLLVVTDGNAQTATEIKCKWEPGTGSTTGQLTLLIQDGKTFGAKGRLPSLALEFQGSPPATRTESTTRLLVDGDLHPLMTLSTTNSPRLTEQSVLYAQQFVPQASDSGVLSLTNGVESVVESSKGGRTIVAVSLEWVPR